MIRNTTILKPLAWLAVVAVLFGGIGGALPVVLCVGANGHVAVEAPHGVQKGSSPASLSAEGCHSGPCVDFALHVSSQKEEVLYPALVPSPQLATPMVAIVSTTDRWGPIQRDADVIPGRFAEAPPPLSSLGTVVLLI